MNLKLSKNEEYAIVGCFLFARVPNKRVVKARERAKENEKSENKDNATLLYVLYILHTFYYTIILLFESVHFVLSPKLLVDERNVT